MSETEGNETFTTADKITAGTKIKGQLASSTDVDYFKYTTSGAASLNLSYDLPTSSNTDYFSVQILNSNNNILSGVGTGNERFDLYYCSANGDLGAWPRGVRRSWRDASSS